MSKQVVEVVYGRHYRYDVVRSSSFFSTHYYVRRDDGRLRESLNKSHPV